MNVDLRTLPLPHPAADALARHRRTRAARALAGAGSRGSIVWAELSQFPEWAFASDGMRDTLAWASGAWRHRDALRRCIDGGLLDRVRARLGNTAFSVLMEAPASESVVDHETLATMCESPQALEAALPVSGREWLLASVGSSSLRRCLRELWWPNMPSPPISAAWHVAAREDVASVVKHCMPDGDASS